MNIRDYTEELISLRHHFHQHPELALQEVETSAYIRRYLEKLGYEITPVEPTGLIAELPGLKDREKLVVLRAEMDALPIQEQTGLPYASVNQGCMHACGHDFILAAALIFAKIIAEEENEEKKSCEGQKEYETQKKKERFPVRIRFLFEPAEEIGEGARRMLQAGALQNPKADAFLMFHYAADMTLGMAVHQGQASSMINSMQIHVHGKSSHWCEAEKGIDAIYAAARVVDAIHDLNENFKNSIRMPENISSEPEQSMAGNIQISLRIMWYSTEISGQFMKKPMQHWKKNWKTACVRLKSRPEPRSAWSSRRVRYMHLPMMMNWWRSQRRQGQKCLEINLSWRERMSCFCPGTMHTDISEKPEDFFLYSLQESREKTIRFIIRNSSLMRGYCRTVWRHCIK